VSRPRGRGKIERFFKSVEQLLLEQLPGYAPKEAWPQAGGEKQAEPRAGVLTLGELEQRFRTWRVQEYHHRVQKSLEQLDLLLVQVARKRRIQRSGIAFEGSTSIDPTLAAYVGEEVQIRYDPLDLAEVRVSFEDRFICRVICPELSGQTGATQAPARGVGKPRDAGETVAEGKQSRKSNGSIRGKKHPYHLQSCRLLQNSSQIAFANQKGNVGMFPFFMADFFEMLASRGRQTIISSFDRFMGSSAREPAEHLQQ
jgi:hypothetical protein